MKWAHALVRDWWFPYSAHIHQHGGENPWTSAIIVGVGFFCVIFFSFNAGRWEEKMLVSMLLFCCTVAITLVSSSIRLMESRWHCTSWAGSLQLCLAGSWLHPEFFGTIPWLGLVWRDMCLEYWKGPTRHVEIFWGRMMTSYFQIHVNEIQQSSNIIIQSIKKNVHVSSSKPSAFQSVGHLRIHQIWPNFLPKKKLNTDKFDKADETSQTVCVDVMGHNFRTPLNAASANDPRWWLLATTLRRIDGGFAKILAACWGFQGFRSDFRKDYEPTIKQVVRFPWVRFSPQMKRSRPINSNLLHFGCFSW